jgi:sucrose phosphorylase
MNNKVQLIAYVDRFGGGDIKLLQSLVKNELKGVFDAVHLLPYFYPIDGKDAGFDPIDHKTVDERLGNWNDIKELSKNINIVSDLIVNHISSRSVEFKDFLENGKNSRYNKLFLTPESVFKDRLDTKAIEKIFRPRPGLPFTKYTCSNGLEQSLWTTFSDEQIDIDLASAQGQNYLDQIIQVFQESGISLIRLDAVGYAIKKAGSSCFMIHETYEFITALVKKIHDSKMQTLVEIHDHYLTQIKVAKLVDYVYDFCLPTLVLDVLFNNNASSLKNWYEISPRNAITVLDTHDGIGIVDVGSKDNKPGLVDDASLDNIVNQIHKNSNYESAKATGAAASNLDIYQVNCTYFDALGKNKLDYLIARAIQFFSPGIPQVFYVGFLAGENDMDLLQKSGVGRDINRRYYSLENVRTELKKEIVQDLIKLIIFRNTHAAFSGAFSVINTPNHELAIQWKNKENKAVLHVDLISRSLSINFTEGNEISELTFTSIEK